MLLVEAFLSTSGDTIVRLCPRAARPSANALLKIKWLGLKQFLSSVTDLTSRRFFFHLGMPLSIKMFAPSLHFIKTIAIRRKLKKIIFRKRTSCVKSELM
jgi:hypothetical protein